MENQTTWLQKILDAPVWIKSFIGSVTLLAGFVAFAWDKPGLVLVISVFLILLNSFIILVIWGWAKQKSPIVKDRQIPKFRHYQFARIGAVLIGIVPFVVGLNAPMRNRVLDLVNPPTRPDFMIVLDASERMLKVTVEGESKWNVARTIIQSTIQTNFDNERYGLAIFGGIPLPAAPSCDKNALVNIPFAGISTTENRNSNQNVIAALDNLAPAGNGSLPEAIHLALQELNAVTDSSEKTILIITGGGDACQPPGYEWDGLRHFISNIAAQYEVKVTTELILFASEKMDTEINFVVLREIKDELNALDNVNATVVENEQQLEQELNNAVERAKDRAKAAPPVPIVEPRSSNTVELNQIIRGEITNPAEPKIYSFTAEAGQEIYYDGLESDHCFTIRLIDSTGTEVFRECTSDYYLNNGKYTFTQDGNYSLIVGGDSADIGAYSFKIWNVPPPREFTIAIGDEVSGQIEIPTSKHHYTFTAAPGQVIFYASHLVGTWGFVDMSLRDSENIEVFQGGSWNDTGPHTLTRGGTYTLIIGDDSDWLSSYSFKIWNVPSPKQSSFTIGDVVTGTIEAPSAYNIHTFTAIPGQTIYFDGHDGCAPLIYCILVTLVDPSGNQIFQETTSVYETNKGPFILTQGGTYTVFVGKNRPNTGSYEFKLTTQQP